MTDHTEAALEDRRWPGPQQRMLLRDVVASHAMPAIVRHPARKGPTSKAGCRVHGAVRGGPLTAGYYFLDRWAACWRMRRRVHRRRPFWRPAFSATPSVSFSIGRLPWDRLLEKEPTLL